MSGKDEGITLVVGQVIKYGPTRYKVISLNRARDEVILGPHEPQHEGFDTFPCSLLDVELMATTSVA